MSRSNVKKVSVSSITCMAIGLLAMLFSIFIDSIPLAIFGFAYFYLSIQNEMIKNE